MRDRLDLQIRFLLKDSPRTVEELVKVTEEPKNDVINALAQLANRDLVIFDKKQNIWKVRQ